MADLAGGESLIDVKATADLANTGIAAKKNGGSSTARRPTYNFIEGSNITLTVTDNSGSDRIDLTIASSGGGTPSLLSVTSVGNDPGGNNISFSSGGQLIFTQSASSIGSGGINFGGISGIYRHSSTGGIVLHGNPRFNGTNTTGGGSAALGSNCPAVTASAPYTWIQCCSSDGSTVYVPCWK